MEIALRDAMEQAKERDSGKKVIEKTKSQKAASQAQADIVARTLEGKGTSDS